MQWKLAAFRRDIRAGLGTEAVEGSPGEERNESVKSKDRVHAAYMCLNGTPLGMLRCNLPMQLPHGTE